MPWVRLHGVKDYLDMIEILGQYPKIKQTFNMVPSLLEQILEYADGSASDPYLNVSRKKVSELTEKDKDWILDKFFQANPDYMIAPYKRYLELFKSRRAASEWNEAEWGDLQALFNLAWIDPSFKKTGRLRDLSEKGSGYSEDDKLEILAFQKQIISQIIPRLREYKDSGQIEISTTPYFHPIMPLLFDTDIAAVGMPGVPLPSGGFRHPEDVDRQVAMAVELYADLFGDRPKGMWPSEGSVSEDIIPILKKHGIEWIATDEDILARSLDLPTRGEDKISLTSDGKLYKSYRFGGEAGEIRLFFRDRGLSDNIGFVYSRWDPEKAADDFISKLAGIRDNPGNGSDAIVSVILDGENAWEYYKNDGHDFLNALYQRISAVDWLETTTFSGYLGINQKSEKLQRIFPGSWINHNFGVWIGHKEDNKAWELLAIARDELVAFERTNPDFDMERRKLAWREIYIAEGSDWCWWFGDDHVGPNNDDFDRLFRSHLANVYYMTDREPPPELFSPIRAGFVAGFQSSPIDYITPRIDGKISHYYEWSQAGYYDCSKAGSSMHKSDRVVSGIYFGFDPKNLYIRIDPEANTELFESVTLEIEFLKPLDKTVRFTLADKSTSDNLVLVHDDILEISLPIRIFGESVPQKIRFRIAVIHEGETLETWPPSESLLMEMPGAGSGAIPWVV